MGYADHYPPGTLTTYVVHHRDGATTATRTVQADRASAALVASGLGAGAVHDAKFTGCAACLEALVGGLR